MSVDDRRGASLIQCLVDLGSSRQMRCGLAALARTV